MSVIRGQFFKTQVNPWGLLTAAATIACVATVGGFLGRSWWVFDELSHFRVQYAVGLLVLALAFALGRKRGPGLVSASFAAVNLAVVLPYCLHGRAADRPAGTTIRVVLINVHTENQAYDRVEKSVRQSRPDVLILEEVDALWMQNLEPLRSELPHSCSEARPDNFGIALFSRIPMTNAAIQYFGFAEVPSVTAELEVGGRQVVVVATHPLPPGGAENARLRNEQLEAVAGFATSQPGPVILAGDLNATPWSHSFRRLLKESRLTDSARGFGYQPTWPAALGLMGIPLDHCLVSSELQVTSRNRGSSVGSDHLPLILEILVPAQAGQE